VDVIVAGDSRVITAAKQATSTIPIVMTSVPTRLVRGSLRVWRGRAATSPASLS
jgi:ABC-type uncharacterized transport system substrate-binding protein